VGQRLYADDNRFASLSGRDNSSVIHIEDPFLLGRNLNCALGRAQPVLLYNKFCEAHAELQNGNVPRGFRIAMQMHCDKVGKAIQRGVSGFFSQSETADHSRKSAIQDNSQESIHSGASVTSLRAILKPDRRNGRRGAKMHSLPQLSMLTAKSFAPIPDQIPSTRLALSGAPVRIAPGIPTINSFADMKFVDGATWSL